MTPAYLTLIPLAAISLSICQASPTDSQPGSAIPSRIGTAEIPKKVFVADSSAAFIGGMGLLCLLRRRA